MSIALSPCPINGDAAATTASAPDTRTSSFRSQYCFSEIGKESQNKADEYDSRETSLRTQTGVPNKEESLRNADVLDQKKNTANFPMNHWKIPL